jgi:BirA family biotin operon repressor/biotin-[acetyl-CoA-carboxylase] ligase
MNKTTNETFLPHKCLKIEGSDICFYKELSSTNHVAQLLAKQGAADGLIVMCSYQSAGVGRMQRPWLCPPGKAITMSIILKPAGGSPVAPQFTLLCGVAAAETARSLTGADVGLKWPNDVLIDGRKVCGILAQSHAPKTSPRFTIAGIGLNVGQTEDELPDECRSESTSLSIAAGRKISRAEALRCFLRIWNKHYNAFAIEGYSYIRENWIANNITLGRKITLHGEPEQFGIATDISDNGGLLVQLADGEIKELRSEEFTLGKAYYRKVTS